MSVKENPFMYPKDWVQNVKEKKKKKLHVMIGRPVGET